MAEPGMLTNLFPSLAEKNPGSSTALAIGKTYPSSAAWTKRGRKASSGGAESLQEGSGQSQVQTSWPNLFELHSTIALPSAALPYLYSWAGVETPAWTWATDPAPSPTAISASPRYSVYPEVKVSGSFLLAYGLRSLRCHCWDQKRAWTALFGLAYDWRLLKEKKRKGKRKSYQGYKEDSNRVPGKSDLLEWGAIL